MSHDPTTTKAASRSQGAIAMPGVPDGLVLYDGVCVLCSAAFRFVARRDRAARFRFTPVQGAYGRWLAMRLGIDPDNPQSNAAVIDGRGYVGSDATLMILRNLPRWHGLARLLLAIPRPLRDRAYDAIARRRYALFGRKAVCMIPGPELARHTWPDSAPHG